MHSSQFQDTLQTQLAVCLKVGYAPHFRAIYVVKMMTNHSFGGTLFSDSTDDTIFS